MFSYKRLKEEKEESPEIISLDVTLEIDAEDLQRNKTNFKFFGYLKRIAKGKRVQTHEIDENEKNMMIMNLSSAVNAHSSRCTVVGPGGTLLPKLSELTNLVDNQGRITVMCFTWNVASESTRGLHRLNAIFAKIPAKERPSVISVAIQELPTSTLRFHTHIVDVIGESLSTTHEVYCWVRKWSQMLIIFIKKSLCLYASRPEYKFVATEVVARPFRTKGAIGIAFRLLQTSCVFIACHLTHGKLKSRILDYHKISRSFDFECFRRNAHSKSLKIHKNGTANLQNGNLTTNLTNGNTLLKSENKKRHSYDDLSPFERHIKSNSIPIKRAANVFWFGDLNFRVRKTAEMAKISDKLENRLFRRDSDFEKLLENDELNLERKKGYVFEDFKEGLIRFPPTHKFIIGTNKYAKNRVPSYTDRILYWSKVSEALVPIRYDCIWDVTTSDHKPVYCTFQMDAIDLRSMKHLLTN